VVAAIVVQKRGGGLKPRAVNLCQAMGGRVVWCPTISAPNHIEDARTTGLKFPKTSIPLLEDEPIDIWASEGTLKDEVHDILRMIADADAVLASGHMPAPWIIAVFHAA